MKMPKILIKNDVRNTAEIRIVTNSPIPLPAAAYNLMQAFNLRSVDIHIVNPIEKTIDTYYYKSPYFGKN